MKPSAAALSVTLALALLAAPVPSSGQQPAKVYRIGWLGVGPPAPTNTNPHGCPIQFDPYWQATAEGLREYGYVPGQNLLIECRWNEARAERAPALAAELVSLQPHLIIVLEQTAAVRAAMQATRTIPIVLVSVNDPVAQGLVASLAHPGGNVTGISGTASGDFNGKRLQLLKEVVPKIARVVVLRYVGSGASSDLYSGEAVAAQELGLTLQVYGVRAPEELEEAFAAMTKDRAEALFGEDWAFIGLHGQRIAGLAAQHRLPTVFGSRRAVVAGGLMAYWVDGPAIYRRIGCYVDKILQGANPADLPVEQPTKFEVLINLKTAKALGLTIPQVVLLQADEVIQ